MYQHHGSYGKYVCILDSQVLFCCLKNCRQIHSETIGFHSTCSDLNKQNARSGIKLTYNLIWSIYNPFTLCLPVLSTPMYIYIYTINKYNGCPIRWQNHGIRSLDLLKGSPKINKNHYRFFKSKISIYLYISMEYLYIYPLIVHIFFNAGCSIGKITIHRLNKPRKNLAASRKCAWHQLQQAALSGQRLAVAGRSNYHFLQVEKGWL